MHKLTCIKLITVLFCYIFSTELLSYPQNIRLGYSSCQACHVSPSGGGVLNEYGKMTTGEMISTWSYQDESSTSHGLYEYLTNKSDNPSPVMVGGDIRAVQIYNRSSDGINSSRYINMQKEFELGIALDDRLTVVGTIGEYAQGDKFVKEYRRHYILYNFNQYVSVRAGKFQPAYGLNIEDHTMSTRAGLGFGEGVVSHNLELVVKNLLGEISLTPGVNKNSQFGETEEGRYKLVTEEKIVNFRVAANIGEKSQVGISGQVKQDDRLGVKGETKKQFGFFSVNALTKNLYFMSDNNWRVLDNTSPVQWHPYLFNLVGLEILKGFHVQLYYEQKNLKSERGFKLQWFPRPHWELSAIYENTPLGNVGIFLFHYYL